METETLRPFFTYYGGKWRIAPRYPAPAWQTVVEPFAGAAGYALRHPRRNVHLFDMDERVAGTWRYLIATPADEIRRLPLFDGTWQTVDDLALPQEARWLIGWWLNKGTTQPAKSPSAWMRAGKGSPGDFWGPVIRERIARQVDLIRHWRVTCAPYWQAPLRAATWFVDPPYEHAGKHYRYGASGIEFGALADWCRSLPGQVIVCENTGAEWLPFEHLLDAKANESRHGGKRSAEAVWMHSTPENVPAQPALAN